MVWCRWFEGAILHRLIIPRGHKLQVHYRKYYCGVGGEKLHMRGRTWTRSFLVAIVRLSIAVTRSLIMRACSVHRDILALESRHYSTKMNRDWELGSVICRCLAAQCRTTKKCVKRILVVFPPFIAVLSKDSEKKTNLPEGRMQTGYVWRGQLLSSTLSWS